MPTCAPVETAAQTLPQPKKTSKNVPKNSPIAHFGTGVCATSTSALTCGGGSGRVALIVSLISQRELAQQQLPPSQQLLASVVTL